MKGKRSIGRRGFVKLCASAMTMLGAHPRLLADERRTARQYNRVKLVHADGRDLRVSDLRAGESFVFSYPYVATPCFLINLGHPADGPAVLKTEDGRAYEWRGGVGPHRSVVAFSAICAHRMSHPSPRVSFISYRHDTATFVDSRKRATRRPGVIFCCSEKSVYDPGAGAQVLGGPAGQPLAAIDLRHDGQKDCLYAAGSYGGEMFEQFLEKFGDRLALELRTDRIHDQVTGSTTVMSLAQYSRRQIRC